MDVGQTIVAPGVAVGQFFVIKSHEVKHGSLKVMDMDPIVDSGKTKLVSGTVAHPPFYSASSHPDGISVVVVIAPLLSF